MSRFLVLTLVGFVTGCGSGDGSGTTAARPTAREQAVASCERRIDASALAPALKAELKKTCAEDPAGDGMTSPDQETRRRVCRELVRARVPAGPARQRGLAACAVNTRNP